MIQIWCRMSSGSSHMLYRGHRWVRLKCTASSGLSILCYRSDMSQDTVPKHIHPQILHPRKNSGIQCRFLGDLVSIRRLQSRIHSRELSLVHRRSETLSPLQCAYLKGSLADSCTLGFQHRRCNLGSRLGKRACKSCSRFHRGPPLSSHHQKG